MTFFAITTESGSLLRVHATAEIPGVGEVIHGLPGVFSGFVDKPHLHQRVVGGALVAEDIRTLAQLKADKWAEIKAARDAAITAPKTTSHGVFDADEASQNNLNKVIALLNAAAVFSLPTTANYTLANNSRVALTLVQLQTAALEIGGQVQAAHDTAAVIRTQINSSTALELGSITWPAT